MVPDGTGVPSPSKAKTVTVAVSLPVIVAGSISTRSVRSRPMRTSVAAADRPSAVPVMRAVPSVVPARSVVVTLTSRVRGETEVQSRQDLVLVEVADGIPRFVG